MHLRTLGAASLLALAAHASADVMVLTQWDFNQYAASGALTSPLASIGTGTASGVGLGGAIPLTGSISNLGGSNVSSDPTQPGTAWNSTNYAAQGTREGLTGVQFVTSTAGVTDGLFISFDVRGSNTASRFIRLLYSLDGSNFVSTGLVNDGLHEITGGQVFNNSINYDLSTIAGVRDNGNFAFRIVTAFAPGTNAYAPITNGSNYGTGGTLRYDMVMLGAVIPSPGALALMGLAAIFARPRRRALTHHAPCAHAQPSHDDHPHQIDA